MATAAFKMATNHCSLFGFATILMAVIAFIMLGKPCNCVDLNAYFPMMAVKLMLPFNEKSESIFSKIPLGTFQVLTTHNNTIANDYIYSLEQNDLLRVNSTSGEVFMKNDYNRQATYKKLILTAISKTGHGELTSYTPHVSIEIIPVDEQDYCKNLEHLCFWTESHYMLFEDLTNGAFKPLNIGTLNARGTQYLCGHIEPKFKLETSTKYLKLQNNLIYTKKLLDHETLNVTDMNMLTALVTCKLKTAPNKIKEYQKLINITIVDRNDNGPELQHNQIYNFHLDEPHFKMHELIGNKILFVDKDSMAANVHQRYKVVNDSKGIVNTHCNTYESDHTGKRNTIISCQLIFARNGILSQSPYCFELEASDLTIDSRGNANKSTSAHVCLHTNVEQIHYEDRPLALALSQQRKRSNINESEEHLEQSNQNYGKLSVASDVKYPADAYVYRLASNFYRVAQPVAFLRTPQRFTMIGDRAGVFGITPLGGIVYVKDNAALQQADTTSYILNISWHDSNPHYHAINIHVLTARPDNATCEYKVKSRSQTCAQMKNQRRCEKFCGLATNGGSCVWRGSNSVIFSRNFASCVPNAEFCPDNICDPLEQLNNFICPQDCIRSHLIMGPVSSNNNSRGILSASGTCTCEDNGKCSCAPIDDDDDEPKVKRRRKNENKVAPNVLEIGRVETENINETIASERTLNVGGFVCGKSCMIIAATCPLVFMLLIVCLIISRRNIRKRSNGKEGIIIHKGLTQTNDNGECGDFDIRNGDLPLMQLENGFKFESGDDKWEFDRSKLILDSVLGEGEFGKVMKGYATDIAGLPDVTTVAVKMLKNGANSVEYMSLLSEFQLLQEVSHPNVIKLLGACTQGDSPMIIIEYARYGSLRSYLRLSRKIECSGVDFTDGVEPVTVKQILSFAWQICKGMTYLTEIKLVHRDLAARNVLVADGKICKVSDFGLTRDVYEDDAYLKRSRDRVPVKWMAPESLADHVYTTKSDVWAFGVLCWELITLGASPYPGVPPQNLYHLLKSGYRMERPENCSEEIYTVIRSCWTDDPNARPSFKYLASQFEKLLGNNAKYIEIETNAVSNPIYCSDLTKSQQFNQSQTDISKLTDDFGEPDNLEHLWRPPSMSYDTQDAVNSREFSTTFSAEFMPPPGYDLPRPLIEASTTEQVLRYENDLRFPLNVRQSVPNENDCNNAPHYSVPVKRGRSYVDMTKKNLIPDNLDSSDFEKHVSKTISFRFSSLLNLQELDNEA